MKKVLHGDVFIQITSNPSIESLKTTYSSHPTLLNDVMKILESKGVNLIVVLQYAQQILSPLKFMFLFQMMNQVLQGDV